MAYPPVRTVAPSARPVSLGDAKAHLNVSHGDDDGLILLLIDAAAACLDGWTGIMGRCLVTQTWRQDFDEFADKLRLPFAGPASVAVTYRDTSEASQTLAATEYDTLSDALGAFVTLKSGKSWPSIGVTRPAVSVTAVYGSAVADVPAPIKSALLLHIGSLYRDREATTLAQTYDNAAYMALLAPYRRTGC